MEKYDSQLPYMWEKWLQRGGRFDTFWGKFNEVVEHANKTYTQSSDQVKLYYCEKILFTHFWNTNDDEPFPGQDPSMGYEMQLNHIFKEAIKAGIKGEIFWTAWFAAQAVQHGKHWSEGELRFLQERNTWRRLFGQTSFLGKDPRPLGKKMPRAKAPSPESIVQDGPSNEATKPRPVDVLNPETQEAELKSHDTPYDQTTDPRPVNVLIPRKNDAKPKVQGARPHLTKENLDLKAFEQENQRLISQQPLLAIESNENRDALSVLDPVVNCSQSKKPTTTLQEQKSSGTEAPTLGKGTRKRQERNFRLREERKSTKDSEPTSTQSNAASKKKSTQPLLLNDLDSSSDDDSFRVGPKIIKQRKISANRWGQAPVEDDTIEHATFGGPGAVESAREWKKVWLAELDKKYANSTGARALNYEVKAFAPPSSTSTAVMVPQASDAAAFGLPSFGTTSNIVSGPVSQPSSSACAAFGVPSSGNHAVEVGRETTPLIGALGVPSLNKTSVMVSEPVPQPSPSTSSSAAVGIQSSSARLGIAAEVVSNQLASAAAAFRTPRTPSLNPRFNIEPRLSFASSTDGAELGVPSSGTGLNSTAAPTALLQLSPSISAELGVHLSTGFRVPAAPAFGSSPFAAAARNFRLPPPVASSPDAETPIIKQEGGTNEHRNNQIITEVRVKAKPTSPERVPVVESSLLVQPVESSLPAQPAVPSLLVEPAVESSFPVPTVQPSLSDQPAEIPLSAQPVESLLADPIETSSPVQPVQPRSTIFNPVSYYTSPSTPIVLPCLRRFNARYFPPRPRPESYALDFDEVFSRPIPPRDPPPPIYGLYSASKDNTEENAEDNTEQEMGSSTTHKRPADTNETGAEENMEIKKRKIFSVDDPSADDGMDLS